MCKQWLPQHLSGTEGVKSGGLVQGVHAAFTRMNQDMAKQNVNYDLTGTTACALLFNGEKLLIMNVGDSRAVVGYMKSMDSKEYYRVEALTRDHKPTIPTEQARIEASGGVVRPIEFEGKAYGPPRIWIDGQQAPGLCMSRSLGDEVAQRVCKMYEEGI